MNKEQTQKRAKQKHSLVNRNFYTVFFVTLIFGYWGGVEDTIVVQRVFLAATGKRFSGQKREPC